MFMTYRIRPIYCFTFVASFLLLGLLFSVSAAHAAVVGTYTSPVKDYGGNVNFGDMSWNTTIPSGTAIGFYARVCADATCSANPAWTTVATSTVSGYATTTFPTAITDNNRYFQYQTQFEVNAGIIDAPIANEVNVRTASVATVSGTLTSSAYDTVDAANAVGKISWTATGTTTTEILRLQMRTATTSADLSWHAWCGASTTCNGSNYFTDADNGVTLTTGHPLKTGGDDRFVQYKLFLESEGISSPTVTGVTLSYVVNAPPDFNLNYPTSGAGGVSASQNLNSSEVPISYAVRDPDTTTGSVTPNNITPSFEYSLNNGGAWTTITGGMTTSATTTKSVQEVSYTTYYATWTASVIGEQYGSQAKIRVTGNDSEPANNTGQASSTAFELDTTKPTLSMTAGTAATNNIQFTDADADGVADSRSVTLRLPNLVEHSSSTQGVYVLFSNDGTNYGTTVNSTTGVVTAVDANVLANWEATTTASTFVKPWTLLQSGSRTKTVYVKVRDKYNNEIATPASANVTFNKPPEFENATIVDADASNYERKTNSKVVIRQCNVYDTDANCTAGKVKVVFKLRDADGNESPLASKGNLHVTYATSSDGSTFATSTNSDLIGTYATTTVSLTNADAGGSYNPSYSTSTAYFNPSIASGNLVVRLAISDNEQTFANSGAVPPTPGVPAAYATSNTIAYDSIVPANASPVLTFDAGVAGDLNGASVTLNHPTDATSTQYLLSGSDGGTTGTSTAWTLFSGAGPTARTWTFSTGINTKALNIKYRDTYGNTQTSTTTVSTVNPLPQSSFLIQDISNLNVSPPDYKLYIAWETSTSTSFASYKLEYATSSDNITFGSYSDTPTPVITASTTNFYVHPSLNTSWYYRYRVGVKDTAGNTTVRSSAYVNAKPDGVQNLGEGGGGTSPSASIVNNVSASQGSNGAVTVTYTLTDTSKSSKTNPTYEAYIFYNTGVTLGSNPYDSGANTLLVSDASKMLASGFVQINQEVWRYTGKSGNVLTGVTRGTWPTAGTTRQSRQVPSFYAGTPLWIWATSTTPVAITDTSVSTGQNGTITWTTSDETGLAGSYLTNVGINVVVHDNQSSSAGPLSSQNDSSETGLMSALDLKAPTLGGTSLLINGSTSSTEAPGTNATLSLQGLTTDTSSETIYIQFATSTGPVVYRGGKNNGTVDMTADSWGDATTTASFLGTWSWPLSGRSETVTVRVKDAKGNISNTDTNSIIKNAVPEFNGTQTDADASSYEAKSNSNVVIRQCNIYDTDALCTAGKIKIKFQTRDPDAGESLLSTAGKVKTTFESSISGAAYQQFTLSTYSDGSLDTQSGTSTVNTFGATSANAGGVSEAANYDPVFTTVTAYYDPSLGSSATVAVRITVTDNEAGTTAQTATSNTINYDKLAPSGTLTFDGGIAGTTGSATVTIPVPTDATTTQYMLADDVATHSSASTTPWTLLLTQATKSWTFDSDIEAKSLKYQWRDTYANTAATSTASATWPPMNSSPTSVEDVSKAGSSAWKIFLSWQTATATDFSLYRIEYATSTDGNTYSAYAELVTIPTISTNYYLHSSLSNSLWYRYRLSTKNTAGNYSVKSVKSGNAYVTAKPDGSLGQDETAADDTAAPSLNTVASTNVKATIATVTWNSTDNISLSMNSTVYYAAQADFTTNVNASKTGRDKYVYKFGNPGYVTVGSVGATAAHSVALANLTKNLQYRYGVETCDATGNCGFNDNSEAGYTFTTQNGPVIVVAPTATPSFDSASITWKTDKSSDGIVFYATTTQSGALVNPITVGSNTQVTTADGGGQYPHTVSVPNLAYSTTYYYKARSTDQSSSSDTYTQYDESSVLSFTTGTQSPPVISGQSCATTDLTAKVTWTTDHNATTELSLLTSDVDANYFNTTPGAQFAQYPAGTIDSTSRLTSDYGTSHEHTFTGLTQTTAYYVKVRSLNRSGGEASVKLTCTTAATQTIGRPAAVAQADTLPPLISSITIKDLKATSATITWQTDELADSLAQYGTTISYGSLNGSVELVSDHTVVVSGLNPQTSYNFKVTSADKAGNRAYAGDQSFTTLSPEEEALIVGEDLESLRKELEEFRARAKTPESLDEAIKRFKNILQSVSTDIALSDLEAITSDISDTISELTQEITPPTIIGGVPQVEVESTKATVKWRTNKPSSSIVALVPQPEYNPQAKEPYTLQVGQPQEEVTSHAVTIPNLESATVYHFQIRSKAKVGPEGKSRDFVFETRAELPQILNYSFRRITESSITVSWTTNVLSTSLVRYTPFDGTTLVESQSSTQGKPDFVKEHEVTVTNLKANTNYLIEISSADVTGASTSKVIGTVRTTIDTNAPQITKVRSESTIFPGRVERTQTIIFWETDEPSTSQVFWKEGVAKGDLNETSRLDQSYTTSHVVVLTTFKPGSVYRFQVESVDPANNKSRSTDFTILTPQKGETVIDLIIQNFQDIFGFLNRL